MCPGERLPRARLLTLAGAALMTLAAAPEAPAPPGLGGAPASGGSVASKIDFEQKLNAQVPLDLTFADESGKAVRLGDYFGEKPVILTLVYYKCPMLCNEVLNALTRGLRGLNFDVGGEFEVVTVSIDPTEPPALAASKKSGYMRRYGREGAERGWHFLTGDEGSIRKLADSVGFRYVYMPESRQYAHAAGITLLTPSGKVARYLFGISYAPKDLRLGLTEASAGTISSPIEQVLLFCYQFDPTTGRYTFAVMNAIRALGTATAVALAAYILTMLRRERKRDGGGAPPADGSRVLPTTP